MERYRTPLELAQPDRLLLLTLLPLLYFFSLPPRPKATVMTAHLAQWLEARRKLKRRPVRFRWLRFLLLVAAFCAVVVAHAEPRWAARDGATELVILVDTSASMAAPGADSASAMEAARRSVAGWLTAVPEHVDVRLGFCADALEVVRGTRAELLAAVRERRPSGRCTVDLAAAAAALSSPRIAVATVTDGLGQTLVPTVGALRVLGVPRPNGGVSACEVRDAWPLPEVQVEVECVWFGAASGQFQVVAEGAPALVATVRSETVTLAPGVPQSLTLALRRDAGGVFEVRLQAVREIPVLPVAPSAAEDAWDADNVVRLRLPSPPRPRIAVRAEGQPTRALTLVAAALAAEAGGEVVDERAKEADFLILEGGTLPGPPAPGTRMLSFGTQFGDPAEPPVRGPRVVDWNRSQPITRGLDLSELSVAEALPWKAPGSIPGGFPAATDLVLVEGSEGPLAVLRPRPGAGTDGEATVHFAFRLGDSNLFKLAAFPQWVRRSFAAAYGAAGEPALEPGAVLALEESRLQWAVDRSVAGPPPGGPPLRSRPLPPFAVPDRSLVLPMLLLGLLLLAIRVYV